MSVQPTHEALVRLRADVATQRADLASLRAVVAREHRRRSRRRFRPLALIALFVALLPMGLLAAGFTDLNPSSPHNDNITAIAAAGITKGCNPPTNDQYCPNDLVTREQMASFLARTAGLGNNPPVANAARLALDNPTAGGPTYAANDLARVTRQALAPQLTAIVDTTEQSYGPPLSITAPAAGFVLVTISAEFTYSSGTCPCNAAAFIRHLEDTTTSGAESVTLNNAANDVALIAQSWVFPVTAGVNTFQVVVRKSNHGANTGTLATVTGMATALYIPFGATGAGSLGVETAPGEAGP